MLDKTSSIICAFGLASAAPRSPYRHLELCGIALRKTRHVGQRASPPTDSLRRLWQSTRFLCGAMRASRPTLVCNFNMCCGERSWPLRSIAFTKIFGKHLFPYSILRTLRTRPCLSQPKSATAPPRSKRRGRTGSCKCTRRTVLPRPTGVWAANTSSCWLSSGTTARRGKARCQILGA